MNMPSNQPSRNQGPRAPKSRLTVIGVPRPWDEEAMQAIANADVVIGSQRQYDSMVHGIMQATGCEEGDIIPAQHEHVTWQGGMPAIMRAIAPAQAPVVLASGDPLYFGIVRKIIEDAPQPLTILPAPSTVSTAFAKLGLTWDNATVVSAHGRDHSQAIAIARTRSKVAILTEPGLAPHTIAQYLQDVPKHVWVCAALGEQYECIGLVDSHTSWPDPNIVIVVDHDIYVPNAPLYTKSLPMPRPDWDVAGHDVPGGGSVQPCVVAGGYRLTHHQRLGLPDNRFTYRDNMITKSPTRLYLAGCMQAQPGLVVWDVGCGSGSVGIEAALAGACVYAIDTDKDQISRTQSNARTHHVNVATHHGTIDTTPSWWLEPDVVYLGGGGMEALTMVLEREGEVPTIVATYACMQTFMAAMTTLEAAGYTVTAQQLSVNTVKAMVNGANRLDALNPVFVLQAMLPDTRSQEVVDRDAYGALYPEDTIAKTPGGIAPEDLYHQQALHVGEWTGTERPHG